MIRRGLLAVAPLGLLLTAWRGIEAWVIEREASSIRLSVGAFGVRSSGRFETWRGDVVFDPDRPAATRATVVVQTASLRLSPRGATGRALGPGFLDAARHPTIQLELTSLAPRGGDRWTARADLTVRGVTRAVSFPMDLRVTGDRAQMTGALDIDRATFGIGTSGPWNRAVSRQVNVQVSLQARRAS